MIELARLKSTYPITAAWGDLGLPGKPGKICRSPLPGEHKHGDAHPSFSVFDEGRRWKDFANGEGGDVIDFVAKMRGSSVADAIRWIRERYDNSRSEHKPVVAKNPGAKLPPLRLGTADELCELADRRGFMEEALRLAQSRGFLRFGNLWGHPAWCVGDSRRQLHEFRRLDGQMWPSFGRLAERKAHCTGSGKAWPLGIMESAAYPKIAMVEGAPDLLAVFHFMLVERKAQTVAPVGVLGAANHRLAPEALTKFAGKLVCLFPHADEAGQKAARAWALALRNAGAARVTAFDLSGLVLMDGSAGKDVADICRVNADCFENERKFCEVLP
jgi:hypothetical protein